MKTKFNIFLLILVSFTLLGCPAGNFYRYTFTGETKNQGDFGKTKIAYSTTTALEIECGNYIQFIRPKKSGLLAMIKIISDTPGEKEEVIKTIVSSTYGEFKKIPPFDPNLYMLRDTLGVHYYEVLLNNATYRKLKKRVQNDTISILLQNNRELIFVKKN